MTLTLTISNLYKSYNGNQVLKGCTYSFDREEVYVLIGPNGSGKSTFLRLCALLEEPDGGTVNYLSGGDILADDIDLRRRITLVLPKVGIFNTTVFKNVAYGLKVRGAREIEKKVNRALELVDLNHKKNQNALTLSSGETQRLGIARAIVIKPEILLLDEPTSNLDPRSMAIIEDIINEIKKTRTKIILVTQNMSQGKRLADKILFLIDGRIIECGDAEDFFANHKACPE